MDFQALLVGIIAIALGAAMMLLGYRLALILLPGFFVIALRRRRPAGTGGGL